MSLINTRLQNMRLNSNLDKFEIRPSRYGALDLFLQQTQDPTGIITGDLKAKVEASIGNTVQVPVIDYDGGVTIGNTRSATIADSENTSQLVNVTFATYAWGFTIVPALFSNNEVSIQKDFEKKFNKYLYKLGTVLDAAGVAALSAAKSQVFADLLGKYTNVGNVVDAALAYKNEIIGDLNVLMSANDFYEQLHFVGNAGFESIIRILAEKGLYNSENKQLQYSDKILHFTNRISNATDKIATGYAVNQGSTGLIWRFEREALLGTKARTGHEWGIETLPMLNLPVGTYFYESVGDFSGIAGAASADLTRARKEHYGFAVDIAFVTAYNSDPTTLASPILAVEVANA